MQKNIYLIGDPLWFFTDDNIILYFFNNTGLYMFSFIIYIFIHNAHTKKSLF
jgi:hypothetical protein